MVITELTQEQSTNEVESGIIYNKDSWNIGMRRVTKIIAQEETQGNKAWSTGMYSRLPDIMVLDERVCEALGGNFDALVRVYEVTNYKDADSLICKEKAERYKNTLMKFKCQKVFVCSYEENLNVVGGKQYFEQHGIEVQVVGYQD